jgi:uncharacterized protein (DUF433 family)
METTTNQSDADSLVAIEYAYITRQGGVRGGNPIVAGTRIGVHDVVGLLQNGETVDSIVSQSFPDLTRAQVYECLAYYEDHRGEIDLLVARQMSPAEPS